MHTEFRRTLFLILCCVISIAGAAQTRGSVLLTDSVKSTGRTYALLVGISKYANVSSLKYADKDAIAFNSFLRSEYGGKVPSEKIYLFTNEEATKINITDALSDIAQAIEPGDRFYFFFAGHGDMEVQAQKENGLLLLHNSPNGSYFGIIDDVLEIAQLRDYLSPLSQKGVEIMYIIDACHSGKLSGGNEGVRQTAAAMLATWGREYKILSCQPNQLSLEGNQWGGGRGLFSLKLEEALKGGADMNKDGQITMLELYLTTLTQVSKASNNNQIPLMSGDLSKQVLQLPATPPGTVKPAPKTTTPESFTRNDTSQLLKSLDARGKAMYFAFETKISEDKIIFPWDTNALKDYRAFCTAYPSNALGTYMKRRLIEVLPNRFNKIVTPLLKGDKSYSSTDECYYAALELDSCLGLLGTGHYLYPSYKARKLYMDAMALTWALSETEFNASWRPTVEKALKLLEESAELEPNAAYTSMALGERYNFVANFEMAEKNFTKYLALRPRDYYGKLSLALLYNRINQFEKAEALFREIADKYPGSLYIWYTADALLSMNKPDEARKEIGKILALGDTSNYLFYLGIFNAKRDLNDSAIYYYKLTRAREPACDFCDNNIGHMFLVTHRLDSATFYFRRAMANDEKSAFPNFNLGTIETLKENFGEAINYFIVCIDNTTENQECIVTHSDLYFNKTYINTDNEQFKQFSKRVYIYKIQYLSYLSILYCYLRDEDLKKKSDKIDLIFSYMFKSKEFDMYTWYHYACWKSLNKDMATALESLEKSLVAGFGSYYQISNDKDLDYIRDSQRFKDLLKKYFPEEVRN